MARLDEKQVALARIYSRAILDLLNDRGEAEELLEEMHHVVALMADHKGFARLMTSPLIEAEERKESIERIFRGRASDLLVDTLQVINRKGRLGALPTIVEVLRRDVIAATGRIEVDVVSAVPLDDTLRDRLQQAIRHYTDREPLLEERVDPALIGGFVLYIGDEKIDASVIHRIHELRSAFVHRAAREIHRLRANAVQPVPAGG